MLSHLLFRYKCQIIDKVKKLRDNIDYDKEID